MKGRLTNQAFNNNSGVYRGIEDALKRRDGKAGITTAGPLLLCLNVLRVALLFSEYQTL